MKDLDPPAILRKAEQSLDEIATDIRTHEAIAAQNTREGLEQYRIVGSLLLKAKSQLPHGHWLLWLQQNVSFGDRQARKYMRLAKEWDRLSNRNSSSDLDLNGAMKVLTDDPPEEPASASGPWPADKRCRDCRTREKNDPKCKACQELNKPADNEKDETETDDQEEESEEDATDETAEDEQKDATEESESAADAEPEPVLDAAGQAVPEVALPAFAAAKDLEKRCREIDALIRQVEQDAKGPAGRLIRLESVKQQLRDAKGNIWANRPSHVCPYCHGKPNGKKPCECCQGTGWTAKHVWQQAPGTNGKGKS